MMRNLFLSLFFFVVGNNFKIQKTYLSPQDLIFFHTPFISPQKKYDLVDTIPKKNKNYVFYLNNLGFPSLGDIVFWDNYLKLRSFGGDNFFELIGSGLTKKKFQKTLNQLKKEITDQDNLLVYIDGYTWGKYNNRYSFNLKSLKLKNMEFLINSIQTKKTIIIYRFDKEKIKEKDLEEYFLNEKL